MNRKPASARESRGAEALRVDGVSKAFGGIHALSDVSLTVTAGQRHGVIGPNGAGKSTLFSLIGGQSAPSRGRILLFGRDVTALSAHRRAMLGLGRTFQTTTLFRSLSVRDNVVLAAQALQPGRFAIHRPLASYAGAVARASGLLESWGMLAQQHEVVANLSYGEQRRLDLLLALAGSPKVLLLDEPAAGLGSEETRLMAESIKRLPADIAVLLVEHDMDIVFEVVDHITVLHNGRTLAQGPPGDIRSDPQVRRVYLGA